MSLLVPNVGEAAMLKMIMNNTAPQDLVLKLYTNDITPAETDTASTYTEASGDGYAAETLAGADWSFTAGTPSFAQHAEVPFSFTGPLGDVYGYFIVQETSGILMWAERFSGAPYNIQNNGDQIKITPYIELN